MIESLFSDKLLPFISNEAQRMHSRKKNLYKSILKMQNEIIESHRIICLLPYYMFVIESKRYENQMQTYLPQMTDSDLLSSLLRPQKKVIFSNFTMMIQDSSFLINYLSTNSSELAREVVKSKSTLHHLDYYHMMFQIIPSVFGYFHSYEHLISGSHFYQSIIDSISDNPNTAVRILQPFLNSPSTYRYIEYVMTKIFKTMTLCDFFNKFSNLSSGDTNSNLYKEYVLTRDKITKKLLCYLANGVSLLPDQILQIFKRIKNKYNDKWTNQNWYKLVISIFVGPHFTRWSRSHFFNISKQKQISKNKQTPKLRKKFSTLPRKKMPLLPRSFPSNFVANIGIINESNTRPVDHKIDIVNDILSNISNETMRIDFDFFIDALCSTESIYCIPQMYKCFEKCSTQYCVFARDLVTLVKFMDQRKILPSFINVERFEGFDNDSLNELLTINVYENEITPKKGFDTPIIFHDYQIDQEIISKYEEQHEYKAKLSSLEEIAKKEDKNEWTFVLEKSNKDPTFHQYVETHINIQYKNTAREFEEYIEWSRLLSDIDKWKTLISPFLNSTLLAYLHHIQKIPTILNLVSNHVKLMNQLNTINQDKFNSQFEQFKIFINDFETYIKDRILQIQKIQKIQNQNMTYDFTNNINNPLILYKASSIFSMISFLKLPEKYNVFMEFLNIINTFFTKNDNYLFLLLINQISAPIFIKTFIEISTFVIYNEKCFNFLSAQDFSKWQKFESLLYATIFDNYEICQNMQKCQIYFQDISRANK